MKKDKEWLKEEINKVTSRIYGADFNTIKETDDLIDQLDEPEKVVVSKMEKVVIPQFVADWIDKNRDKTTLLDTKAMMIQRCINDDLIVLDWVDANDDLFTRAWLDGYTIEKETMHYVIFLESEDKEYGQALYKDFNFNGDKVVSTHIEIFSKRIALEAGNFKFTEQEIKAIDERYLAFKVEVSK